MQSTYISLVDIKRQLNITDTESDSLLDNLLWQSYTAINTYLGIDTLNSTTVTENILYDMIMPDGSFYVKNFPVTAISNIDGTAYTGVNGTDYMIDRWRKVMIWNFGNYLSASKRFPYFSITYTAWYIRTTSDTLPADIKQAQWYMVTEMYNKRAMAGVSNYALWDESISFSTMIADNQARIKPLLVKYKKGDVI